ncbi:MAG: DUF4340 domain-containing protein [Leptolyngbya sp. PLA3]|nr:MAG: DUF4340 domain-containing protein [Cyanobacteria bacterium CYA]MCE7969004.1 DUF4340 domain-containing protein [Leptolyngbya sp. PL-A3]
MNTRGYLVLIGVAALLAGLSALAYMSSQQGPAPAMSSRLFPDLMGRINDVTSIELTGPEGQVRMTRQGNGWVLPEKTGVPAVEARVRPLIIALAELEGGEPKTTNPDLYTRIGVEEPGEAGDSTLLTVSDASGQTLASLILGKTEWISSRQMRYVRKSGDVQSWLIEFKPDTSLDASVWAEKTLTRVDGSRVKSVVIRQPSGEEMILTKTTPEQPHYEVAPIPEGRSLRSEGVADPLARGLQQLNFEDVRPAGQSLEGLVTAITFQTFDGLTIRMSVVDEAGSKWATLTAEGAAAEKPEELAELQARFAGREFQLPTWAFNNLNKRMIDMIASSAPQPEDPLDQPLGPLLDPDG